MSDIPTNVKIFLIVLCMAVWFLYKTGWGRGGNSIDRVDAGIGGDCGIGGGDGCG